MASEARLRARAYVPGARPERPRLDVDLALGDGVTVLMGPSGAGKTTLLMSIAGLLRPEQGRIVLDEAVLFDAKQKVFVPPHRRRIALVFQSLALFPHLRAWQNVTYGLPSRKGARASAHEWLTRARVEHVADRFPEQLSGGEAQRVALARALASEPAALLLDEPFSALDAPLRKQLGEELRILVTELRLPTLLVTHDRHDATQLGSRLVELDEGRVRLDR